MMIASSAVSAGTSLQFNGGEMFSPIPIPAEPGGIGPLFKNHELSKEISSGTPLNAGFFASE
jgi:hypothetical protein